MLTNLKETLTNWSGEILRQTVLFPVIRRYAPLKVEGRKNLANLPQSVIFAANHASHFDTPSLLAALPLKRRLQIRVAAAADYFFKDFWKSRAVRLLFNAVPFARRDSDCFASLQAMTKLVASGHDLLIYPEGTRTTTGEMARFKKGVGLLVNSARVPVVPVYLAGTYESFPKGAHFPRRHQVTVRFGAPLYFAPGTSAEHIAAQVENAVRALSGDVIKRKVAA
jgi:1-acyl-sn-glycerol-3-phosphate acyltransferase